MFEAPLCASRVLMCLIRTRSLRLRSKSFILLAQSIKLVGIFIVLQNTVYCLTAIWLIPRRRARVCAVGRRVHVCVAFLRRGWGRGAVARPTAGSMLRRARCGRWSSALAHSPMPSTIVTDMSGENPAVLTVVDQITTLRECVCSSGDASHCGVSTESLRPVQVKQPASHAMTGPSASMELLLTLADIDAGGAAAPAMAQYAMPARSSGSGSPDLCSFTSAPAPAPRDGLAPAAMPQVSCRDGVAVRCALRLRVSAMHSAMKMHRAGLLQSDSQHVRVLSPLEQASAK